MKAARANSRQNACWLCDYGVFYFLPFFLVVSAAKIFNTNEYLAAAVVACLMYPTLIDAAKALAANMAIAGRRLRLTRPTFLCCDVGLRKCSGARQFFLFNKYP